MLDSNANTIRAKHQRCDRICHANIMSASTFHLRHITDDCDCDWIKALLSNIQETLDKDEYSVPDNSSLMDPNLGHQNTIRIPSDHIPCVAISHIWSQGTGSDTEDGLPRCRLQSLLDSLKAFPEHAFWSDSLCIRRDNDLKMKSIAMMEDIYRTAAIVIAIDSTLRPLSTEDSTTKAFAMQFLMSDWNGRLWTFSEAILVKKLRIAFKIEVISVESLERTLATRLRTGIKVKSHYEFSRLHFTNSKVLMHKLVMLRDRSSSVLLN